MIKKIGVFIVLFVFLLSLGCFAAAQTNYTTSQQNQTKIDDGFDCLKDQVRGKCSDLSIQEISLTILASPDEVTDECKSALQAKKSAENCWGNGGCNVLDTSLAVLALNHLGENTDEAELWLLSKNMTATDLIWYLQQDSTEATQCKITYDGIDYTINVDESKKIDSHAGNCLSLAQSNFWLQISPNCYDTEFRISCDKNFISTLLYKQTTSPTLYVLSGTESAAAFGTISLKIKASCFATGSSCNYEESVWATLALLKTGHNVENFIPYIVALADSNTKYLPNAFIYMITGYDEYGTQLIQEQELGDYWLAAASSYNKFYDTALALVALQDSSTEQVIKAKDWLLFSQSSDGCWQTAGTIRDTAIILWGLVGRSAPPSAAPGVTYCTDSDYFCIPTAECPSAEQLPNFFCSGLSTVCCVSENLQACSDYVGEECGADEICTGNERKALDTDKCCLGECVPLPEENECEDAGYICRDECGDNQEGIDFECDVSGEVCCRTKSAEEASLWWIWLLIIGILIVLGIIAYLQRARLKLWWFKFKSKFRKEGAPQVIRPGYPPRPGFPPIRRQPMPVRRPMPPQRPVSGRDKTMEGVFGKLKTMSK